MHVLKFCLCASSGAITFFVLGIDNSDSLRQRMLDLLAASEMSIFCNFVLTWFYLCIYFKYIAEAIIIIINKQMEKGTLPW